MCSGSLLQWHPRERPKSVTVREWLILCHCKQLNFTIRLEIGKSEKCHCSQMALYCVTVTSVTVSDFSCINLLTNGSNLASPLKWTTMVHFMMKIVRSISSLYKNSFTLWVGVLCDELFKCESILTYLSSPRGRRLFSTTGTQARIRLTIFWSTAKEGSTRLGRNERQQHQQLSLTSNLAPDIGFESCPPGLHSVPSWFLWTTTPWPWLPAMGRRSSPCKSNHS